MHVSLLENNWFVQNRIIQNPMFSVCSLQQLIYNAAAQIEARLLLSGRSPESSDCLLKSVEQ